LGGTGRKQIERAFDAFSDAKDLAFRNPFLPDSILEKSRMSLINESRVSPLYRMISANPSAAERAVYRAQGGHAITPFIGVANLVTHHRRNWLFAMLPARRCDRCCAVPIASSQFVV